MNAASSTSTALSSRPGSDPVFGRFGGLFRTTLRSLRLQWFLYRTERRKTRPIDSVGDMNAHMLRDIGASDEMIVRAAAPRAAYERHGIPFGLSLLLVVLAVGGTGTPTSAETVARANGVTNAQAQIQPASVPMAGVFAGEYLNGAPVYRFPAVVVTGSRKDRAAGRQEPCRQTLAQTVKGRA